MLDIFNNWKIILFTNKLHQVRTLMRFIRLYLTVLAKIWHHWLRQVNMVISMHHIPQQLDIALWSTYWTIPHYRKKWQWMSRYVKHINCHPELNKSVVQNKKVLGTEQKSNSIKLYHFSSTSWCSIVKDVADVSRSI